MLDAIVNATETQDVFKLLSNTFSKHVRLDITETSPCGQDDQKTDDHMDDMKSERRHFKILEER